MILSCGRCFAGIGAGEMAQNAGEALHVRVVAGERRGWSGRRAASQVGGAAENPEFPSD
jgi:hypothetical protein